MITTFRAKLAFTSFLLAGIAFGQTDKLPEEKELEVVNFRSIKKVLEQDGLDRAAAKKKQQVAALKTEKTVVEKNRFLYPSEDELWGFASEYWLVKNAQVLGWDFDKPEYGLESSYRDTLTKLGFYQKRFKILLLNTPTMVRGSMPGNDGEMILMLSVPFIRSLDLSKLEISLLLVEDFFRLEAGYFKKAVRTEKLNRLSGTNFFGQRPDLSMMEELLKRYSKQLNDVGYNFQQQFEVTKKMDSFLKSNPELWNAYYKLLGKMDRFLKVNLIYRDYVKLYPSPEMQLKWLSPEEKVL